MSNDTPELVAEQATQKAVLKRGTLTLIGIAGGGDTLRALILLPSGKVVTTQLGETSRIGTVLGIDETRVILKRGNKHLTLDMPS